ncbi:hypothetical protein C2S51_018572 [Perilla frutescens var. frutescens]|nr:hypothetical protein C2S51_018572 [Perilla frutescens var. frutescens]
MAAYAALVTLVNLMEDMQNHPRLSTCFDKKQIESLGEKVHFLLNFIESYDSHGGSKEAEDLEGEIVYAAQEAEDVIESHIVDRILAGDGETVSSFLLNVQKLIEEMDSIKKKIVEIGIKNAGLKDKLPKDSMVAASSRPRTNRKTSMVGFEEELIQLMDVLTGQQSSRKIISIVGMGGMGKTTLTRNAYENSLIVQHFDIRAWATVSQEYSAREILLELLSYGVKSTSSDTDSELGERLYKNLLGKRYLIVLDDMWSMDAWDEVRVFLPDNGHRSRIVITTRLSNLASHVSLSSFVMNFLDKDKSWKLFCEKAFGEDGDCPLELVEIGKEIVEKCQGLPLSIVVIGGYLSKSTRKKEHWEYIANDVNSVLSFGEDDQCLKILSLSYSHLPAYLKPCFLYMGTIWQDGEIYYHELIRLWVAEGFLKPNKVQSLEEIGESYFNDLVERNLILVHWWGNGRFATYKIHDLLRELCLKVAKKEKFLCVLKLLDCPRPINRERRVAIHGNALEEDYCHIGLYGALKSEPLVRSLIGDIDADCLPLDFRLLKILNVVSEYEDLFNEDYLEGKFHQQVNLRYLGREYYFDEDSSGKIHGSSYFTLLYLPSSISLLWNLQTLSLHGNFDGIIAPCEIWEMPQIRHLFFNPIYLPEPPPSDQQHCLVLRNLQTLNEVGNFRLSEEVCKRIPNIKVLHIWYGEPGISHSNNLGRFCRLESLNCIFSEERISRDFALRLTLPSSLQELCLIKCFLHWEELTIVGSLPCLEVLRLGSSMKGNEWNPIEGEFLRLKYMEIWSCDDLINWNADNSHFPVLESLNLRCFSKLAEIPSGIGEIPTLRHIQLEECGVFASISAMRILVEQERLGNLGLQLEVELRHQEDHQKFKEMVQEEGLNSNNLRLRDYIYRLGMKKSKNGIEDANDLNKPKRPPSAFFIFMEDFVKQYKEKHPNNKSIAAIGKAGGDKWRSMSDEEKTPFVAEAGT